MRPLPTLHLVLMLGTSGCFDFTADGPPGQRGSDGGRGSGSGGTTTGSGGYPTGSGGSPVDLSCNLSNCDDPRHECTVCRLGEECECDRGWGCFWGVDQDGDGTYVLQHGADGSEPDIVAICSSLFPREDCDDSDASVETEGYWDRDGDGISGERVCTTPGTEGVLVRPWQSQDNGVPYDCDDGDPDTTYWVYVDEDGDGVGASDTSFCAPLGPGLSYWGGDCDESDPLIPSGFDLWGDGVDADCDGVDADGGQTCISAPFEAQPVCEGLDLVLEDCVEFCSTHRLFRIGNAGTVAYSGEVVINTGSELSLIVDLAPGEATQPISLHLSDYGYFSIRTEEEDCDLKSNNSRRTDCESP